MVDARLFQALSDRTRLEILSVLGAGPVNVSGIVAQLGCAQPAVSRHLRVLREASLIRGRRHGKEIEYSIEAEALAEAARYLGQVAQAGRGQPEPERESAATVSRARRGSGKVRRPTKAMGKARPAGDFAAREADYEVRRAPSGMDDFLL
jgi:DNA-binding transcriptional ArsR family regulator